MRDRIEASLTVGFGAALIASAAAFLYSVLINWGLLAGIAAIFVISTLTAFFVDLIFRSKT